MRPDDYAPVDRYGSVISRLTATDVEWSVGEGPEIRGPISAILLLLTGRRAALPRLSGPGVDDLRARVATG